MYFLVWWEGTWKNFERRNFPVSCFSWNLMKILTQHWEIDGEQGTGNSDLSFFPFFFFSTHRCFSARHENSHCAFSPLFVRANVKGGWVFTGQRAVEIRDREEEEERRRGAVKCHGDYLMSDVIVKTVEP